jgi:hypothetical protein
MLTEGRYATIHPLEHEDYLAFLEPIDYGEYTAFHEDTDMKDTSKTSETRVRTVKAVGATGTARLTFPDEPSTNTPKGGSTKPGRGGQGGGRDAGR